MIFKEIVMIGAGNVAQQLAKSLWQKGHRIVQVYNRTQRKGEHLAQQIDSTAVSRYKALYRSADLYIIAVKDDAIQAVSDQLSSVLQSSQMVVHVSGATPSTVLAKHFERYGIFYPLQTFSSGDPMDFNQIPLCIYASKAEDEVNLLSLAEQLSEFVYRLDDTQRTNLHVAAVFANNFTTHLFHIAQQILEKEDIPFQILMPIIQKTVSKLTSLSAKDALTGPARRKDFQTIQKHQSVLDTYPAFRAIYDELTDSILQTYPNT